MISLLIGLKYYGSGKPSQITQLLQLGVAHISSMPIYPTPPLPMVEKLGLVESCE